LQIQGRDVYLVRFRSCNGSRSRRVDQGVSFDVCAIVIFA